LGDNALTIDDWYSGIQKNTEKFLTWRKRRKLYKKEKQRRKNPVLDWIEVILSAVIIVFLINQYFFQAYQIPTGSMIHTLEIEDRIFVDKFVFGPELIPGQYKIDGLRDPDRGEIIIFENPSYISKGPEWETLHRIIYMLTFTFIDLNKDPETGLIPDDKKQFFIKRAIGTGGDRIRTNFENIEIKLASETEWHTEKEIREMYGLDYPVYRRRTSEDSVFNYTEHGILDYDEKDLSKLDQFEYLKIRNFEEFKKNPANINNANEWRKRELGWYIDYGHIFPLGDNRDESKDARYFGPINLKKVLGKAVFRFWPLNRFGIIEME
jgi:signal peptidase I